MPCHCCNTIAHHCKLFALFFAYSASIVNPRSFPTSCSLLFKSLGNGWHLPKAWFVSVAVGPIVNDNPLSSFCIKNLYPAMSFIFIVAVVVIG